MQPDDPIAMWSEWWMNDVGNRGSERANLTESVKGIQEAGKRGRVFAEAVNVTRMPMIMADPGLPGSPIIFANDAFLAMSGYSREEVLGRGPYFLAGDSGDEQVIGRVEAALAEGGRELVELLCHRKDGRTFTSVLSASPITDEHGQVRHFFSFFDMS